MDDSPKTPQTEQGQPEQPQQPQQPSQPYPPYTPYPNYPQPAPSAQYAAPSGVPNPPQYPYGQFPYAQPVVTEQRTDMSVRALLPAGLLALGILVLAVAFLLGGEAKSFALVGLAVGPFMLLAVLAYIGMKNQIAAIFAYICLLLLLLVLALLVLGLTITPFMNPEAASPSDMFSPGAGQALLVAFVLLCVVSLVSVSMLLRPVRVFVSRVVPIDPDNFVHTIALCILTFFLLNSVIPLIALGGKPPTLEALNNPALKNRASEVSVRPIDQFYQFMWMLPLALVGAGWLVTRKFREVLVRLGMVRPTIMQIGVALGLGVALAAFSALVLDPGILQLWQALGWPTTNLQTFEKILSNLMTPFGAVLIGVTAGISEEMLYRGLLQPRIGLVAANLIFTASHASQYGFDGLLSVFIVGLVLGIVRARSNTTTSAIVHGTFDFVLVLASVLLGQ